MYGKHRKLKTLGRYLESSLAKARVLARQVLGEVAGADVTRSDIMEAFTT